MATEHAPTASEYIVHHLTFLTNKKQAGLVDWSVFHLDSLFFSIALGLLGVFIMARVASRATSGVPGLLRSAGQDQPSPPAAPAAVLRAVDAFTPVQEEGFVPAYAETRDYVTRVQTQLGAAPRRSALEPRGPARSSRRRAARLLRLVRNKCN